MKLLMLKIQGFKSFSDAQFLDFASLKKAGFYYVTGENKVEPQLGANAAGKSAMFEALCWVLFGKTSTNLIAGDVGNWDGASCEVKLDFEKDGISHYLYRTWNPNALLLDNKVITQEGLEKVIGLNFKSFLYSVFIAQFSSKFFDLQPAEKLEIFTEIMDDMLQCWDDASVYSRVKSQNLEPSIADNDLHISYLEGKIEELAAANFDAEKQAWESKHQFTVAECEIKIENTIQKIAILSDEKRIKELEDEAIANKVAQIAKDQLKLRRDFIDRANAELKPVIDTVAKLRVEVESLVKKLTGLNSLGPTCVTCGQKINKTLVSTQRADLEKELLFSQTNLDKLKLVKEEIEIRLKKADDEWWKLDEEAEALGIGLGDAVKQLDKSILAQTTTLSMLKSELKRIEDETNPYLRSEELNQIKLHFLKRLRNYTYNSNEELKQKSVIYGYWQKAFKEIKLMVLEEALKDLEVSVNNNLAELGMPDWRIQLDIDSPTKKGTIKKGFTVFVKSPMNDQLVPFSAWSGGEGQRLRLAGTLGLIDFIQSRRGVNWSLEILDEPTQFMSSTGIDDLLSLLFTRARQREKQIFLIDHRDFHTFGGFDGVITITKSSTGSEIGCK